MADANQIEQDRTSPPSQWPGEDDASYRERTEAWWKTRNQRERGLHNDGPTFGKPKHNKPIHLVDIREDPNERGAILVEATAPDGTVERATFSGRNAPERAMTYVEAVDYFEKRKPAEYPKYARRSGVELLVLDAEHEKKIGPPTDADKKAAEAAGKARDDVHGHHAAFDEAQGRVASSHEVEARPIRFADGESDEEYAARLDVWQAKRRGGWAGNTMSGTVPVIHEWETAAASPSLHNEAGGPYADGSTVPPPTPFGQGLDAAGAPTPAASSSEAARLRDIAARRRAPDIENASEE